MAEQIVISFDMDDVPFEERERILKEVELANYRGTEIDQAIIDEHGWTKFKCSPCRLTIDGLRKSEQVDKS